MGATVLRRTLLNPGRHSDILRADQLIHHRNLLTFADESFRRGVLSTSPRPPTRNPNHYARLAVLSVVKGPVPDVD